MQAYEEDLVDDDARKNGEEEQHRTSSLESNMLTPKQYFMINLSKFMVEMVGTCVLGIFYLLLSDE